LIGSGRAVIKRGGAAKGIGHLCELQSITGKCVVEVGDLADLIRNGRQTLGAIISEIYSIALGIDDLIQEDKIRAIRR